MMMLMRKITTTTTCERGNKCPFRMRVRKVRMMNNAITWRSDSETTCWGAHDDDGLENLRADANRLIPMDYFCDSR